MMSDAPDMHEVFDVARINSPSRKNVQGKVSKLFNYLLSILTPPTRNVSNEIHSILMCFNQHIIFSFYNILN